MSITIGTKITHFTVYKEHIVNYSQQFVKIDKLQYTYNYHLLNFSQIKKKIEFYFIIETKTFSKK